MAKAKNKKQSKKIAEQKGENGIVIDGDAFMEAIERQKNELRITSAMRNGGTCNYGYSQKYEGGYSDTINVKRDALIHADLVDAFDAFNPHLAVICEEIGDNEIMEIETGQAKTKVATNKLLSFTVDAVKLRGSFEEGSIVLVGTKALSTGESVKLETPKIEWGDNYAFLPELSVAAQDLVHEVSAYHNGKIAPDPQGDLFEGDESDENK